MNDSFCELKLRIGDFKENHTDSILRLFRLAVGAQGSASEELRLFKRRLSRVLAFRGPCPIIVAFVRGENVGFASCSMFQTRPEYSFSGECSIFVEEKYRGQGIGTALAKRIILRAKELNYHTLIVGSIASDDFRDHFYRKMGFEYAGTLKELGLRFGKWEDVRWYQMSLRKRGFKLSKVPVFRTPGHGINPEANTVSVPTLVIDGKVLSS